MIHICCNQSTYQIMSMPHNQFKSCIIETKKEKKKKSLCMTDENEDEILLLKKIANYCHKYYNERKKKSNLQKQGDTHERK